MQWIVRPDSFAFNDRNIFDSNHIFDRLTSEMISWLNFDPFKK